MQVISVSSFSMRKLIMTMRMSVIMTMTVLFAMAMSTMAVTVVVEEEQAHDIESKTDSSYNKDQFWVRYLLYFEETLNSIQDDCNTKSDKEDTVYKTTENLSSSPLLQNLVSRVSRSLV